MNTQTQATEKITFLKEWTPAQFKYVEKAITRFINSRYWETHHSPNADPFIIAQAKTFNKIADILGLAYTSSSNFAGYWTCNTDLYLDNAHNWRLIGFGHDKNSFTHAIFWDEKENEITFPI